MLCIRNSTYNGIHDIYLDYNQISDVTVLDNCEWWEELEFFSRKLTFNFFFRFLNFRVLSLKGNLLEKIPNYAFRNSFEKSHHAVKLYLSENPWLCNCRLQPRLLKLCQKYKLIIDQNKIQCLSEKNEKEIYGRNLMQLRVDDVCKEKGFNLNVFEILSIVFVILIFLILVNLVYDYYLYKHYGKLPYIVLHTPFF